MAHKGFIKFQNHLSKQVKICPAEKTYKLLAKETDFYDLLVDELRLMNPQLATEYYMKSLKISMKKKTKSQIYDIDKATEDEKHFKILSKKIVKIKIKN